MSITATRETSGLQLKADFIPITVIKLSQCDLLKIAQDLDNSIAAAPKYFTHAPVLIDILNLGPLKMELDIAGLCRLLRDRNIIPVGIRGLETKQKLIATENGLAILKSSPSPQDEISLAKGTVKKEPEARDENGIDSHGRHENFKDVGDKPAASHNPQKRGTKLIHKPIRAGTRVYAKDSDLIILAAVNSGAEIIADGNIHVYGPLRGRALAGASGDKEARIFCKTLEAELVSIAGHYWVKENIQEPIKESNMLQIYLENDKLKLSHL